jgi:hypothetical protein
MSIALSILGLSADVTAAIHGEALTLQPMGCTVIGYAQELASEHDRNGKRFPKLMTGASTVTHIIHIRKSELTGVELKNIQTIGFNSRYYRVEFWQDDPVSPEVDFHCRIA